MTESRIEPSKVTKPIQLLAAWLAGLILINSAFLVAAAQINQPNWASGLLVIASVCNVPIFLLCLFLLQTKFRPEMQEDLFYARYLERRVSVQTGRPELVEVTEEEQGWRPLPPRAVPFRPLPPRIAPSSVQGRREAVDRERGVAINNLLPHYNEIVTELEENGIFITETFGSTSANPIVPKDFVLAIGSNFPIDEFKTILRILLKYDLDGVAYATEPINYRQIYIGSYGYSEGDTHRYEKMNTDLSQKLLSPSLDWKGLSQLLDKTS